MSVQVLAKNAPQVPSGRLQRFPARGSEDHRDEPELASGSSGESQSVPRAEDGVARFLRSFHVLLRSTRLYGKGHPRVLEALETSERNLRAALQLLPSIAAGIEDDQFVVLALRGRPLPDQRGLLATFAGELCRSGVRSLVFLPQTNLGELNQVAELLNGSFQKMAVRAGEPQAPSPDWPALLTRHSIAGVRLNAPLERKVDTILASFMAALLAYGGTPVPAAGETSTTTTAEELLAALQLLAQTAPSLDPAQQESPQEAARAIHMALENADRRTVSLLVAAMTRQAPRDEETHEAYLARLADVLMLDLITEEFRAGRVKLPEVRGLLERLMRELAEGRLPGRAPRASGATRESADSVLARRWADETLAERLYERFWTEGSAEQTLAALRSDDAWCVPLTTLERHLRANAADDAMEREPRSLFLNYMRCLESAEDNARRAVATGLTELYPLLVQLWPHQWPEELSRGVVQALERETLPGIAALLAAVTENLARLALERADYVEFERILGILEQAPRDSDHAHMGTLAARLVSDERWLLLVDAALSTRPLDPALPRLLRRDPERLLDRLGLLLTAPNGLDTVPAMARLIRAIGQPVIAALQARLHERRRQRATTAVKLLAATYPDVLIAALPQVLPGWDWSVQDLAVSELARLGAPGAAVAFLSSIAQAHPLVVPMMLDEIGLADEIAGVPLLIEIAAGEHERFTDVFIRIKAIEALGRMRAVEAADLLHAILRERNGLTHVEPAGLRAAAEEALALIENHPASARIRAAYEAVEKASLTFARPRRYLRVALTSPFAAHIEGPQPGAARVRTISLGGAFLESNRRLHLGESLQVEIRAGLRHIRSTAVVRNVTPQGGGVEFVHMQHEDREKLRRLVQRLKGS